MCLPAQPPSPLSLSPSLQLVPEQGVEPRTGGKGKNTRSQDTGVLAVSRRDRFSFFLLFICMCLFCPCLCLYYMNNERPLSRLCSAQLSVRLDREMHAAQPAASQETAFTSGSSPSPRAGPSVQLSVFHGCAVRNSLSFWTESCALGAQVQAGNRASKTKRHLQR